MAAPKLVWLEEGTDNGNHRWIAKSYHKLDYNWGIRPAVYNDKILFDFANTARGLMRDFGAGHRWQDGFPTLAESQAWCQAREDEAWAAANPVREFSDTEILDFIGQPRVNILRRLNERGYLVSVSGSGIESAYGKNPREAVTAYLRANPPATPGEPASEPEPDREMTLREFEAKCRKHNLSAQWCNHYGPGSTANVWAAGHMGEDTDVKADTFSEALTKCLAAIEARRARTGE